MRILQQSLILRSSVSLVLAIVTFAGAAVAQMQPMDLRESSSIFSRSSRNRPSVTRNLPQPQQSAAQDNAQTQPSQTQDSPMNSSVPQQSRTSSSIQETGAFKQATEIEVTDLPVRTEPIQQTEPISVTAGGAGLMQSSSEDGGSAAVVPVQPAPEAPIILPLPNWEDQSSGRANRPSGQQPAGNYVLSANDYVQITVFQENDLATETRIADDGTINFPLIGVTKIGGKTVNEAVEFIRRRLDADYIVNPQVTLTIVTYSMGRFTILGEVARPGSYDLPRDGTVTLLDAIGSAGGFTRTARASKVTVKRNVNGKEEVITLDAKRMAREGVQPFIIREGDTISVPTTFF